MARKRKATKPASTPPNLRERAEDLLRKSPRQIAGLPARDLEALVHELQVHQIELEMQNEELRAAPADLQAAHELSEAILNTMPGIVLLIDLRGRIIRFNPFLEKLTGWTLEEVRGRSWFQTFLPPRDRKRIRQRFRRACSGHRTVSQLNPILTKDGQERLIEWNDAPLIDHQGKLIGLIAIGQDVTERAESERRAAFQHSLTHLLSKALTVRETIPEVLRLTCTELGWRFGEMWEHDPAANVLRSSFIWHAPHWRDGAFVAATRQMSFRPGEGHIGRVWRDGQPIWISDLEKGASFSRADAARAAGLQSLLAFPVSGAGKVIGVMAFFGAEQRAPDDALLDLVQTFGKQIGNFVGRNRFEESLREREERLRAILNTASDAIITIDRQGVIAGLNPATERMFGYQSEELVGKNVSVLMPAPYRLEHDRYLAAYHKTGRARIIGTGREVMGLRKDGSTVPVFLSVSDVDSLGMFTGILHDISERRQLQRQILQAADEQQRRIAQDLHDGLGSHLNGIALYCQSLVRDLQGRSLPEAKEAARISKLLRDAIEQCRQVARGLHPVENAPEGLGRALRNLASEKRRMKVQCRVHCSHPTPVSDPSVANHLFHIAQEAVNNAIRHGRAGRIDIRLRRTDEALELRIRDNGAGLPGDHAPHTGGLGWQTMAYRAGLINGTLEIKPAPRRGVDVLCRVPMKPL